MDRDVFRCRSRKAFAGIVAELHGGSITENLKPGLGPHIVANFPEAKIYGDLIWFPNMKELQSGERATLLLIDREKGDWVAALFLKKGGEWMFELCPGVTIQGNTPWGRFLTSTRSAIQRAMDDGDPSALFFRDYAEVLGRLNEMYPYEPLLT